MKYLIVTGGVAENLFATNVIKNGGFEVIMAVDAGMELLYQTHIRPDIIVGDFDSVNQDTLEYFQEQEQIDICALEPEKDETDTEFAVREAIRRGADDITIIGATGNRMDHTLANIAVLGIGIEEKVRMCLEDGHNRIRLIDGPHTIKKSEQYGKYVSLVPYFGEVTGVTLEGMKYPLEHDTLKSFRTRGISNEIVEDEAHVGLSSGLLLVIESRD